MLGRITSLLEMIRFGHTVFALPFALLSAMLAWRTPTPDGSRLAFGWLPLVGVLLCMVFGRSAAMAFNRLVDRDIDASNPRTARRHLVTGELSVKSVYVFLFLMSVGFVASTALFLPNRWPMWLALPVLLFICSYSLAKRFTSLAHFWLGAALMLAPICAWIAIRGQLLTSAPGDIIPAVVLGLAVMLWVAGFDIIYACQDEAVDRQANLRSIPARLGTANALRWSAMCHFGMVLILVAFPFLCPQLGLGRIYGLGIASVAILLIFEHQVVRPDDLERVNLAFFQINAIVSIGLFLIVVADLLL